MALTQEGEGSSVGAGSPCPGVSSYCILNLLLSFRILRSLNQVGKFTVNSAIRSNVCNLYFLQRAVLTDKFCCFSQSIHAGIFLGFLMLSEWWWAITRWRHFFILFFSKIQASLYICDISRSRSGELFSNFWKLMDWPPKLSHSQSKIVFNVLKKNWQIEKIRYQRGKK